MDRDGETELSPESAFALLGERLRLSILFALYEATERGDHNRGSVAYSELQEAVDEPDSGKFNYHLSRLTGQFVEKVDEGYAMRQASKSVVRAVLSGTFTDDPRFGPVTVDETCFLCGEPVAVSYGNEHVFTRCRACEGTLALNYTPPGTLSALVYPPAGLDERSPAEVLELAHARFEREIGMLAADTCPECGGSVDAELVVCLDHDAGETTRCRTCELSVGAVAELGCTTCGYGRVTPPLLAHVRDPEVLDLLNVRGTGTDAWERFGVAMTREYEIVDEEEPAIAYRNAGGNRRLRIGADLTLVVE
ncbi:hypothetical protein HUG10_04800 [Halorarum halophilum]|uniref:Uncharacterized protein n=1 Tax=Halorarum halophilum TaxID=2743090 RepID=A0A7D5K0I1_9EURY|nr:hypothetical protein [Halobaculum halophilum]QLG26901.1 hypothetical protein HUG10_04800 [Halobaculum halophilum]